jgi:hypothetical protein
MVSAKRLHIWGDLIKLDYFNKINILMAIVANRERGGKTAPLDFQITDGI